MKEKIYFIPGLMTNEKLWSKVLPFLEDIFEIIYIKIPNSKDFDEINNILKNEIKDENINLFGFSLGGYIASYFAIKNPKRVKKLFMLSSTPAKTSKIEIERRREKLEFAKLNNEISLDLEKAKNLVEEQNQDDFELLEIIVSMFNEMGKEVFITQLESTFNRVDLSSELKNLEIPITMFYSSHDRLLDSEAISNLENEKHNINLIKRFGTSHNIPLEFPEDLAKNIKNWMNN